MDLFYTLLILAGGEGRRMGGRDKGLVEIDGQPLVDQLLDAVAPPGPVVISANRNLDLYLGRADSVVRDHRDGYFGPMAGLEAGLAACGDGPVLCLPCDLMAPPPTLPGLLLDGLSADRVRRLEDDHGPQPLCLGLHGARWVPSITEYLDRGGRSVRGWLDGVPHDVARLHGRLENRNRLTPDRD
ncbi:MAG: molybdenum cofactor guanylyltransferase [Alcanivorax sp.]|nr:molybdenum cofactor guanylyltransferase [Alcanivorax sp.]QJX01856.1 NTP transferase domain-containing protein [Alcanivorax sp. IO_7]MAY09156.1 molybdenum cofactor guanylyltransferase [Alcanivorax sp.]MBI54197.1 molybdenum cofactor guanylyltransferase [Alcanivorax sp.]MBU58426.1 molybdenum cofactor guanylyltransferase [Alcanivorax sp.]|tara:strand:- start:1044 stop:1598 length:555 start_codon:yes stop_codon:yes gene_type:complete